MEAKNFIFDVIKSEFIKKMTAIEITFGEQKIYKISLKNGVIYSTEYVDFNSYFMKYERKKPTRL